jgi:hypothetical protein
MILQRPTNHDRRNCRGRNFPNHDRIIIAAMIVADDDRQILDNHHVTIRGGDRHDDGLFSMRHGDGSVRYAVAIPSKRIDPMVRRLVVACVVYGRNRHNATIFSPF